MTLLNACTYLRFASVQDSYRRSHADEPHAAVAKHLLETPTVFVYGRLLTEAGTDWNVPLAVIALCSRWRADEIVEINHLGKASSFYGLNLPVGEHRLLAVADVDSDGHYEQDEVIGEAVLRLSAEDPASRVRGGVDIQLGEPRTLALTALPTRTAPRPSAAPAESLFYPKGSLRALEDSLFGEEMTALGMYDPAAFMERAPMMFYALEDDLFHKIPIVFVHGIGGSTRDFDSMVERLDRSRFKPWFFFYPSGAPLGQVAALFQKIYLSGEVVPRDETPMIIVAHSMGGLIVREAMNLGDPERLHVPLLITIASPFGGHSAAAKAVARAPMVLPSWRDLDPRGPFTKRLFRNALPVETEHHLFYDYLDESQIRDSRATDGVISLSSQLARSAVERAHRLHGFRSNHTAILHDPAMIQEMVQLLDTVRSPLPEDHLRVLAQGGFDVGTDSSYTPMERYVLRFYGQYLLALDSQQLQPVHPALDHLLAVMKGEANAETPGETAWLKFKQQHPELARATR
jgi:pimeloyl-ACP methyl ester carboxylesterase